MTRSLLIAALIAAPAAQAEVIAFWDFNNGFDGDDPQVVIASTSGFGTGGTLYQQRGEVDGNGKGGNTFVDAANGIDTTGTMNERSMVWNDIARPGVNEAEIFVTINTTDFVDLMVSFDVQGSDLSLPETFDLKYDTSTLVDVTDPDDVVGTVKDFADGTSIEIYNNEPIAVTTSFTRVSYDLSSFDAIEEQPILVLRLDNFDRGPGNDELRIDNLLITGTAVPEPSSALLALAGLTVLARRRR